MNGDPIICQICFQNLDNIPADQRQAHYDRHFDSPITPAAGPSTQINSKKRKNPFQFPCSEPVDDVFWHSSLQSPPPRSYTPGVILLLRKTLSSSHAKGRTARAVLCCSKVVYISKEPWDATWGCGYRNFLMLCTALIDQTIQPGYRALLDRPIRPGMRNVQHWIEDAWRAGFDLEGAQELKKLIGTNKWIGTSDLYTAFVFRGIPCSLAQFDNLKRRGIQPVVDWLLRYFSVTKSPLSNTVTDRLRGATPIVDTQLMPLMMQHKGHSRLIVGYEVLKNNDINLLMFESGRRLSSDLREAAMLQHTQSAAASTSTVQDQVIQIEDTDDDIVYLGEKRSKSRPPSIEKIDHLGIFRLSVKKLHQDQYQILHFPLKPPLTEKQQSGMKLVRCDNF